MALLRLDVRSTKERRLERLYESGPEKLNADPVRAAWQR
jgi:hypothetical protein